MSSDPESIASSREWLAYHDATRYASLPERLPPDRWPTSWVEVDYKSHPGAPTTDLPEFQPPDSGSLWATLEARRTTRRFADRPIDLATLSALLRLGCGLRIRGAPDIGNRTYPSAGARYPLEIYPVLLRVDGAPPGVYHYLPAMHQLEVLPSDGLDQITSSLADDWMRGAAMVVAVTAVFERNFRKYGQRGYRDVLIEAGHLGQNLALVAVALGLGWCGAGAYVDDVVNPALGIDGIDEAVLALHLVGVPSAAE